MLSIKKKNESSRQKDRVPRLTARPAVNDRRIRLCGEQLYGISLIGMPRGGLGSVPSSLNSRPLMNCVIALSDSRRKALQGLRVELMCPVGVRYI